jgi:hypothetical protein
MGAATTEQKAQRHMPKLISCDWHLDDLPQNEYRWQIFEHLLFWVEAQHPLKNIRIYMLGDLCDRKDKHSAAMVNRMVDGFMKLIDAGASIWVLMGNHDMPLKGPAYFGILNKIRAGIDIASGISFHTEPHRIQDLILLPYSDNPAEDWAEINFDPVRAAFIHQTVNGCLGNNGITLSNPKMMDIPSHVKVYSGDIHVPQVIGNCTYVGSPHPVAFGDNYPTRMLQLDEDWNIEKVIKVRSIQKLMLNLNHPDELEAVKTQPGDQAKIRIKLQIGDLTFWPQWQEQITAWGKAREVSIFSIEPEIEGTSAVSSDAPDIQGNDPVYVLRAFADAESIDDTMFDAGLKLLREVT